MDLKDRFHGWLDAEIGSRAAPALRQYLRDRDYRLISFVEHGFRWQQDVYHPTRGFYRATGRDDREALLLILLQVWLVDSLETVARP